MVIAPLVLQQYAAQFERRLNVRGVRIIDVPWLEVDWEANEVVVPEPGADVDGRLFDELDAIAPSPVMDESVAPGRYPIVGCAFIGEGPAPSRALAVALASVAPRSANAAVAALVQVANFPAMQAVTGTVTVANTSSNPLFNRDVDNGERNVVRLAASAIEDVGETDSNLAMADANGSGEYTVPTGKRLVLDTVSLFAYPPAGQKVFSYLFNGSTYTAMTSISQGTFYAQEVFQNSMAVRDYVEPGNKYYVTMIRSANTDLMFWDVNAVGHLVDCTNGGGC